MANELPPVSDCDTDDSDSCTPDPDGKCYTTKEAIPVCSSTNPASSFKNTDCTKLDNTYDKSIEAVVVPAVGGSFQVSVCNPSLYTVGAWVEFVDGALAGSVFQIIAINSINGYISLRNSCSDGESAISGNASPGATGEANSRFIVRGKIECKDSESALEELQSLIPQLEEICLDGIGEKSVTEEISLLGSLTLNDCDGGESPQPCLRKGQTSECKDGTLKLGNLDENQSEDTTLRPLFANIDNKVVAGAAGSSSGTSVAQFCNGGYRQVQGARLYVPFFEQILLESSIAAAESYSSTVSLTALLASAGIDICSDSVPGYIALQGFFHGTGPNDSGHHHRFQCTVNGELLFGHREHDNVSGSGLSANGFAIFEIPSDKDLDILLDITEPETGESWIQIDTLSIRSCGVFI